MSKVKYYCDFTMAMMIVITIAQSKLSPIVKWIEC